RMYDLRQKVARNAGFANYRDFIHREKNRFDYTPEDCMRFHVAVEEAVLPAIERINERRRRRMGLGTLRPGDMTADPLGRPPLHESGHAFHAVEASRLPLLFQRHPGSEMAEVASMSMELLASPYIGKESGGYYSEDDARRSRADLLEGIIFFFPHCASVDAFQHWIYLDEAGRDANARDQKWLDLRRRFEGKSVDWSGLDSERIARWYQQPHFFASPFYYIEYGIAQLGALQVWRN